MTIRYRLKIFLSKWILKFIYGTCRWKVSNEQELNRLRNSGRSILIASWHGRLLAPFMYFSNQGYYALAGTHSDAELISQIAERMGWKMIRGSSTEKGVAAFKHIVRTLKKAGSVIYITPDGPKGPACELKPGTIRSAQLTGAAVLPISGQATRTWGFTNWDTFFVAKPFSRIELVFGEPLEIPRDADEREAENQLKTALDDLSREVDRRVQT